MDDDNRGRGSGGEQDLSLATGKTCNDEKNLKERERKMIEDCDSAVVIWMNNSSVIANELEILKRLGKPTIPHACENGIINIYDVVIATSRYGESDP